MPQFKKLGKKRTAYPPEFENWVARVIERPAPENVDQLQRFKMELLKQELYYCCYSVDCTKLPKEIPTLNYKLVILDPPYGLGKEVWDQKAFTREDLANVFGAFRFIHTQYAHSNLFVVTMVIFCSHEQLSHFIDEVVAQKFKYDVMVWTKPYTTPTCKSIFTSLHNIY